MLSSQKRDTCRKFHVTCAAHKSHRSLGRYKKKRCAFKGEPREMMMIVINIMEGGGRGGDLGGTSFSFGRRGSVIFRQDFCQKWPRSTSDDISSFLPISHTRVFVLIVCSIVVQYTRASCHRSELCHLQKHRYYYKFPHKSLLRTSLSCTHHWLPQLSQAYT